MAAQHVIGRSGEDVEDKSKQSVKAECQDVGSIIGHTPYTLVYELISDTP